MTASAPPPHLPGLQQHSVYTADQREWGKTEGAHSFYFLLASAAVLCLKPGVHVLTRPFELQWIFSTVAFSNDINAVLKVEFIVFPIESSTGPDVHVFVPN